MNNERRIEIYTDGSCPGNQSQNPNGGYGAVVIMNEGVFELSQGYICTTNNRMELRAVIAALQIIPAGSDLIIYSDSKYVIDAFNCDWICNWQSNGWRNSKKKAVLNQDLWAELLEVLHGHNVTWQWVKGHADNALNDRADALANIAAISGSLLPDVGATTANIVGNY
ncbi:ribonuclease HI [Maridesulfovibrio ferrireducens]|uniref:ribonuclease HI n=1 Tax=Maridesulfovibrio ferrireducens TaxID=246191 RepID=UPI001A27EC16|nr:ribonuclease HI [Maridesulfovibrio ferrireducens]MBI9109975.1 ribonuclease HI [Maridesulfovibrio ferrireducens]